MIKMSPLITLKGTYISIIIVLNRTIAIMAAAQKNFTAEEVKNAISGKYELYYSTIRYGYYLPKYKSNIITESYITQVLAGDLYCPKFSDIKLAPCPQPPDK